MLRLSFSAIALIALSAPAAIAGPIDAARSMSAGVSDSHVMHAGARNQKPAKGPAQALKGNGRIVKDTCPGGDDKCIKELVANCDKAGGGLSTEPDGGVDCYVVGIHDQP